MNMGRCENGHFYDADRFSECPHCNPTSPVDDGDTMPLDESGEIGGNEVTPDNGGKTIGYWDDLLENTAMKDERREYSRDPVVGWVVITDGVQMGRDFPLKSGRNFIGRSVDMDIMLEDPNVSRDKHAVIVFDPKSNMFLVTPGESHGLSYINGNVVLQAQQIKAYDVISLGKTQLTFVPFCGEPFNWESKAEGKE